MRSWQVNRDHQLLFEFAHMPALLTFSEEAWLVKPRMRYRMHWLYH